MLNKSYLTSHVHTFARKLNNLKDNILIIYRRLYERKFRKFSSQPSSSRLPGIARHIRHCVWRHRYIPTLCDEGHPPYRRNHQREHHPGRIVLHHLDTHPADHHQIRMRGAACRQQWRRRHSCPLCPVAQDEEKVDLLIGHHRRQHLAGRWNHHPSHHGYHSHRRTRKHQSPPASHPHHTGHHHHHLLCATLWHREYWQVVWSIHADMVPAIGRDGSFQHHVLPHDTEGHQSLLRYCSADAITRMVPDSGCRVPLYHGC